MAASTSKSKLYDFLKGYEACSYTGSSLKEVQSSLFELLTDEIALHPLSDEEQFLAQNAIQSAFHSADSYITKFYRRMGSVKPENSLAVKEIADKAKEDSKALSHLLSLLLQGQTTPMECLGVGIVNSSNAVQSTMDICDKCPYYLKGFCILYSLQDDDSNNLFAELFNFKLGETRYLALSLLKLANGLLSIPSININNLSDYYMLFNHLLSLSKAFELMNPSGEARQIQIDETKELLTRKPLDAEAESYKRYESVLKEVFADIVDGKKAYIQDIKNALQVNKEFIHSKYDPERDPYYSLKGTGQSLFTHQHMSAISSIYELDLFADQFKEFDDFVGFNSPYKTKESSLDIERDKIFGIRTILINNPGKFKGRIIHIFDNPLQDRANYIHRRLKAVLDSMQCDCTANQDKGREFLRRETLTWNLTASADRPGIYNFDFSNATDTLDQHFQYLVLEFVFGTEIARFWDKVSKLRKYMKNSDGSYEGYDQNCGQPQGGLGSFDSFALAHHFIFLMDMKLAGMEDNRATDFYRVLGDDSTCNTIEPEYEYFNDEVIVKDEKDISRSILEMQHFDICKHFAGFIINYDKSESAHWNSEEAKLDFAKVTYRNGKFFSPLPFRLAMRYSHSTSAKLACAIWRGERRESHCREFMDQVLARIDDTTITSIVKSGLLPFLEPFQDSSIKFHTSWLSRTRYAITIAHLTMCLSFLTLDDRKRDFNYENDVDQGFIDLFKGTNISLDELADLPSNHKIWSVLELNSNFVHLLRQVYALEDANIDDKILALLISPLNRDIGETQWLLDELLELADTSRMLRLAKSNPDADISTIFPDVPTNYVRELTKFSNQFMSRGIAKKPREEAVLLESIKSILVSLDEILGYVHPVLVEKSPATPITERS